MEHIGLRRKDNKREKGAQQNKVYTSINLNLPEGMGLLEMNYS